MTVGLANGAPACFEMATDTGGREDPRTGSSERIVLAHCTGTRPHCAWWGNGAPACFEMALGGS
jgi:hypothetical protein